MALPGSLHRRNLQLTIHELVQEFLATTPPTAERFIAARLRALPIARDLLGITLLRPNGEIVSVPWDEEDSPFIVSDDSLRTRALAAAARRFLRLESFFDPEAEETAAGG